MKSDDVEKGFRKLSDPFMKDLMEPDGLLFPVLARVREDQTLMLAIREDYVNIYYRGGNILRIARQTHVGYAASFDAKYNISGKDLPASPEKITSQKEAIAWVESLPVRKYLIDVYLTRYGKSEREFQQLVVWENNRSSISNESEYFITDVEYTGSERERFDMLAVRWLASQRKGGNHCRPALIEMKYGDNALSGKSGLIEHLEAIDEFISDPVRYSKLRQTMQTQFDQLDRLGLMNFNKGKSEAAVNLVECTEKPEVILLLANHNPRSTALKTILDSNEIKKYAESPRFDLRFFTSSFSGYGMHANCMLPLAEFLKRV